VAVVAVVAVVVAAVVDDDDGWRWCGVVVIDTLMLANCLLLRNCLGYLRYSSLVSKTEPL